MALAKDVLDKYTPTIGIECHVQLKTKTKLFSAVGNDARDAAPNSLISHIDTGMPGALPVLNEGALELAVRAAYALNSEPQKFSKFDRKHYFYPDLPKGYQITQYEDPIIKGGWVEFPLNKGNKRVNITRVHMEEDAGKNTHPESADYSLVDLNRAGTPLLEIVGEPDIHSAAEAKAYARELYLIMKYAGVSDVDLYQGNMRFDVNISLSAEASKLGKRTEIKNLNSFRSVENAVNYEINRQAEMYEKGEEVVQETRGWDDAKQKTTSQRGKEEAHDYRYMPEPDIPPLNLDDEFISKVKNELPKLPSEIRQILNKLSISPKVVEDILDNENVCYRVLDAIEIVSDPEVAARVAFDSLENPEILNIKVTDHIKVAEAVKSDVLSSTASTTVLKNLLNNPNQDIDAAIASQSQVSDQGEIEKIVQQVLDENPQAAGDVKKGEMKAIGFLTGQVMAKSQGKANPRLAQETIRKLLCL
jgi:aspartyl-tRNA(Asn)/glutamyl-tRNA(Gln) amidotransferase subunit B